MAKRILKVVTLNDIALNTTAQEGAVSVENFKFANDKQRIHGVAVAAMTLRLVEEFMKKNDMEKFFHAIVETEIPKAIARYYKLYTQSFEGDVIEYPTMTLDFPCGCKLRGALAYHTQCSAILEDENKCGYFLALPVDKQVEMDTALTEMKKNLNFPDITQEEEK